MEKHLSKFHPREKVMGRKSPGFLNYTPNFWIPGSLGIEPRNVHCTTYLDWSNQGNLLSSWWELPYVLENTSASSSPFKIFQNLNSLKYTASAPDPCHYNPIAVRKPHGLKIMMVTLGFKVMRKRKKSGQDPWRPSKRPRKEHARDPLLNRERLGHSGQTGAWLQEWYSGQVGKEAALI